MNSYLANYLFGNEILYKTEEVALPLLVASVVTEIPKSEVSQKVEKEETKPVKNVESPVVEIEIKKPELKLSHKILILVEEELKETEKIFLGKILGSIGTNVEQIDLITCKNLQLLDYQSFISQKVTNKVISFGVTLSKLNWSKVLPPYQTKTFDDVDFLLTDDLNKIEANVMLKKSLWANLQKLFPKSA